MAKEAYVWKPTIIDPETFSKDAVLLSKQLEENGFEFQYDEINVFNLPSGEKQRSFNLKSPFPYPSNFFNFTRDSHFPGFFYPGDQTYVTDSKAWVESKASFKDTNLYMVREYVPNSILSNHRLRVATYGFLDLNESMFLDQLAFIPTGFGFLIDFNSNPDLSEYFLRLGQKRIAAENINLGHLAGVKTGSEVLARVHLDLQKPNKNNHLSCYEVEIREDSERISPNTKKLSPESNWQEDQHHFCLTENKAGFPLIPIDLPLSKLGMQIESSPDSMEIADLNLPIILSKGVSWYVKLTEKLVYQGSKNLSVNFDSNWDSNLVIISERDKKDPFTVEDFLEMAKEIVNVKNGLLN